ncbi:unnamed protein product [Prunus armeniaca]|uniref:Uncharacterized protein n=1 Tax=Prunus armeniaca TaxID=36596 RepID=A0A6J5WKM9_PRUAR|nr:unnamed protein product [Prunus armeniaca]CAB4300595.1 unnamed protein product [Prunus armeniaca]
MSEGRFTFAFSMAEESPKAIYKKMTKVNIFWVKFAGKWSAVPYFEAMGGALGMANSALNITCLWTEVGS